MMDRGEEQGERTPQGSRIGAAQSLVAWLCALTALAGCGGGAEPAPAELSLRVELLSQGSLITCGASRPTRARLTRTIDAVSSTRDIACPSTEALAGDYKLSSWEITPLPATQSAPATVDAVTTLTTLPAPVVLHDGDHVLVLASDAFASLEGEVPVLEMVSAVGERAQALTEPAGAWVSAPSSSTKDDLWRWSAVRAGVTYQSTLVGSHSFVEGDAGGWGAMAVSDPQRSGDAHFIAAKDYAALGLGALTAPDRQFRDIRYADLNNDGLEDIVSNVYGSGCLLIALARPGGGYDVRTPTTSDGSCIGGHGETILVADFERQGRLDIFVPTYERFYYLRNLGNGDFAEVAGELGIDFPNYQPQPEGAAAVDIDLNGSVDIVVGNEILLNDGTGRFTPVDHPFGPQPVFDEGMSVADVDGDGLFDIVKNDASLGPRIFWGTTTLGRFSDAGWMLGGQPVSSSSFGLAVGDLFGDGRAEIVVAGGMLGIDGSGEPVEDETPGLESSPPRVCVQTKPRTFACLNNFVPVVPHAWQDLLMITDVDGDGIDDLVARYGSVRTYTAPRGTDNVFRFDMRDAQGRRTLHGRTIRAECAGSGVFIGLKAVDGGNGYMAQGNYVVSFHTAWCSSIKVTVPGENGPSSYGPFGPGLHVVQAL